jgi:hypothetical protein
MKRGTRVGQAVNGPARRAGSQLAKNGEAGIADDHTGAIAARQDLPGLAAHFTGRASDAPASRFLRSRDRLPVHQRRG